MHYFIGLLLITIGLTGCGKKGPLEGDKPQPYPPEVREVSDNVEDLELHLDEKDEFGRIRLKPAFKQ